MKGGLNLKNSKNNRRESMNVNPNEAIEVSLVKSMKIELKKEINFKFEMAMSNMEISERMIFQFIPKNVLRLKASELKKVDYDILSLINAENAKEGNKEKRTTFFPVNVEEVKNEIAEQIVIEKKNREVQLKAKIKTAKKNDATPLNKDDFLNRPKTPAKYNDTKPQLPRSKTPNRQKPADNQGQSRPKWKN